MDGEPVPQDEPKRKGERLQAEGEFEAALDDYTEREQDPGLSDRERGLLNLRMAECYIALGVTPAADAPDLDPIEASLATAMECLAGLPEQAEVERLIDEFDAL